MMKHIFIINPAAGKYDQTGEYSEKIHSLCKPRNLNYEILVSRAPGDCTRIAQAAGAAGDEVRLYACGGDGTLNEVVNGAADCPNVAVTSFPGGSGNDFIRIFDHPEAFYHLERLLEPEEARLDLIRVQDALALNICSMGFDARIASDMVKYKHLPLVTGSGAYALAAGINIIKGLHQPYRVEVDGKVYDGRFTLICIANGRWYGGGFYPIPEAQPDDGLLDIMLVKDMTRLHGANFIGRYKIGLATELGDLVIKLRAKDVKIHCTAPREINMDGELLMAKDSHYQVLPKAIRFFYPKGLDYAHPPRVAPGAQVKKKKKR